MSKGFLSNFTSVFKGKERSATVSEVASLKGEVATLGTQLQQRSVETQEIKAIYNSTILNYAMMYYSGVISTNATPETAVTIPAISAAINRYAGTLGSMPLELFKKNGRAYEFVDDPRYSRLSDEPNELMSQSDFMSALCRSLLLSGFFFADIIYNGAGSPFLYPLYAHKHLTRQDEQGRVYYEIFLNSGKMITRYEKEVFHLRWNTREGINSDDPIVMLRTTLMMALSLRSHGVHFFKNYANIGGIIEHPQTLGEDAINNLRKQVEENNSSTEKSGRTLILEEGAKYSKQTDSLLNSQYEQLLRLMNAEIARFYGLPPHKLQILDNSLQANMETLNNDFINDAIYPLAVKIEREYNRKILADTNLRFKFNLEAIRRAEFKPRMEGYAQGIQWGVFSPNEVRVKEGFNPRDGGDDYLTR